MEMRGRRVLLCNCEATMPLDEKRLATACHAAGAEGPLELHSQLCRAQLGNFQQALQDGGPTIVGCVQESPLFSEIAEEVAPEAELAYFNPRETAAWSRDGASPDATAKIAALLAEASLEIPSSTSVSYESQGVCLVYGRDESALEAAKQLAGRLEVTVLLKNPGAVMPPRVMDVPLFRGAIVAAQGHLGAFEIVVNGYAPASPSSRRELAFEAPRDNAASQCDLILDLTGEAALFPAAERRDGYFRPDPGNPAAVQKALFELVDLVGVFEKPRYVAYQADICAHGRSRKTGCTRCLDVCPTDAITPDGDHVAIDPFVCGGCGMCASVCPTGAASYQLPPGDVVHERLRTLLGAYRKAGGAAPTLLVHDPRHGAQMISLIAREGGGLPGGVIPFALNEVTQVGIDLLAEALAYGAAQVALLVGPEKAGELEALAQQIGLAETVMAGLGYDSGRIHLIDELDPEAVEARLRGLEPREAPPAGSFLPMGGKRTRSMLALRHLHENAPEPVDILPLPTGAPFGRVKVDTEGCTLCLACVSACPTGALVDDERKPWLGFTEEACVQCGLCRNTCPENVITLEPRLNFTSEARGAVRLYEEPPCLCIRCGKAFGVQRSIDRIVEQLAGKHSMFQGGSQIDRIRMCEDCRVVVQFEDPAQPMAGAPRPRTRTTEDDLREREIEQARARLLEERSGAGPDDDTRH